MKEPVVKQINLKKEIHDLHHRMETNLARRNKLLNSKNAKEPHIIRLGSKRKKMKTQIDCSVLEQKKNTQNIFDTLITYQPPVQTEKIRHNYLFKERSRKQSLKTEVSHKKLTYNSSKKSIASSDKENTFMKSFEDSVKLLNQRNSIHKSRGQSREKNKTMSDAENKKLEKRLKKIKQYQFVEKYLSDLQLQCMFKQFELSQVPEIRWPLLIVDEVYRLMKTEDMNPYKNRITRQK